MCSKDIQGVVPAGKALKFENLLFRKTLASHARNEDADLKSRMENKPEWHSMRRRCSASSRSSLRSMSYRLQ